MLALVAAVLGTGGQLARGKGGTAVGTSDVAYAIARHLALVVYGNDVYQLAADSHKVLIVVVDPSMQCSHLLGLLPGAPQVCAAPIVETVESFGILVVFLPQQVDGLSLYFHLAVEQTGGVLSAVADSVGQILPASPVGGQALRQVVGSLGRRQHRHRKECQLDE